MSMVHLINSFLTSHPRQTHGVSYQSEEKYWDFFICWMESINLCKASKPFEIQVVLMPCLSRYLYFISYVLSDTWEIVNNALMKYWPKSQIYEWISLLTWRLETTRGGVLQIKIFKLDGKRCCYSYILLDIIIILQVIHKYILVIILMHYRQGPLD